MKAFLFDRDGTLIINKHYLSSPTGIRFLPCAIDTLKYLSSNGYKLFVITNQSGVKRGHYSKSRIDEIHRELMMRLQVEKVYISGIFYCEHHPNERCNCRKPGDYFLKLLIRKYDLDPSVSYFVGDRREDIEFGKKWGLKTILIKNPLNVEIVNLADYAIDSLCEIPVILNEKSS